MYQFKCDICEYHGEYHCLSMLLWKQADEEEYVTGDIWRVRADAVEAAGEHDAIVYLLSSACARIARKVDRTLF
jgi:hypothetical protein